MTKRLPHSQIILGIDPGTAVTGYGVIEWQGGTCSAIDYGCIRIPASLPLVDRYFAIFENLTSLVIKFKPDSAAIETQFVQKNPQSALKIGMARGVAIIAVRQGGVSVYEYTPSRAKQAVTGCGRAGKQHMQRMIQALLHLPRPPTPHDAADALALALCHIHTIQGEMR